jgi:hypothetical protein
MNVEVFNLFLVLYLDCFLAEINLISLLMNVAGCGVFSFLY